MQRAAALTLLACLAALPGALAGTADSPEVEDAEGDQDVDAGPLVLPEPAAFDDVDLLSAWFESPSQGSVAVNVVAAAAIQDAASFTISFTVEAGPTSLPGSTATGERVELTVSGGAVDGVASAAAATEGARLTVTIPLAALGAVGGDILDELLVSATRTDPGNVPDPVDQDDQTGSDDAGPGAGYAVPRPPIQPGVRIELGGVTVRGPGGERAFPGLRAEAGDGSIVTATATLTNTGSDPDQVVLALAASEAFLASTVEPNRFDLGPGESATAAITVAVHEEAPARLEVSAASGRGAIARAVLELVPPDAPGAPDRREPIPEGLDFLSPAVKALGLDNELGEYGELFLLGLLVLLLILIVFLLLFLVRTPWVRVRVEPRTATAGPGGTAEFKVRIENLKRRHRRFKARLTGDPGWKSGMLLRQTGNGPAVPPVGQGEEVELELVGRNEPGDALIGSLRVKAPEDKPSRPARLEIDVVPLDDDGVERPGKGGTGKVRVRFEGPKGVKAEAVRLAQVRHEPPRPRSGQAVSTTATVRNDGEAAASLRVVLLVDGKAVVEDRVEVPARSARAVVLPWTAGKGRNEVKVQVYTADKPAAAR